jgi:hypothetical protein
LLPSHAPWVSPKIERLKIHSTLSAAIIFAAVAMPPAVHTPITARWPSRRRDAGPAIGDNGDVFHVIASLVGRSGVWNTRIAEPAPMFAR